jgi:putative ABC transport system ATP-binding protein
MITIKCTGIKKFYHENNIKTAALNGVDLEISDKKLTLLVGPSGSGKTTLMSIIQTIVTPDEGDLYILGQHVNNMNELEKAHFRNLNIGVVFQNLYLIPSLTVLENVTLPMIIKGEDENIARKKGIELLQKLNIEEKIESAPTQLSRGQQQRVAIARALINDPKIIMCDEPTSALDQEHGSAFMAILQELVTENRTVLVITHDYRIFHFADQIIKLNDGLITEEEHA